MILILFIIRVLVFQITYSEEEVKYFDKQYFKNKEYFKRKVDEDSPFNMSERLYRKHHDMSKENKKWSVHHPYESVAYYVHEDEWKQKY